MTIRQVDGRTITSEKVTHINSKSYAQMVRRVQWANLVNLYRAFAGTLHPSFENRPQGVSDYNEFMSANFAVVPVYLTRDEARQGGAVVADYQVTRGSLPTIDVTEGTGGFPVTDIQLGSLTIDGDTTLAEFSQAVVDNNAGYAHGDQLSCYVVKQSQNTTSAVPYVAVKAMEVTLDLNATDTLLSDVVDADGFASVGGRLGRNSTVNGAVAWVHSRLTPSGTKVSTQRLYVSNSLLAQYQSAAKRAEAIASYGGGQEPEFLTPNATE